MAEYTPNFNLKKPAPEDFYNVQDFNENWDKLDSSAVKKGSGVAELSGGTLEDRPDPAVPGRYYFAQDKGAIYLDTGSEWVLAAASNEVVMSHLADNVPHIPYATAAGAANTYTVTLDPVPSAYTEGMALAVKINADSTAASTINVNSLGAKAIKKANGTDVTNLKAGGIYTMRYSGVNFILQGEGGEYGTAGAARVLAGYTIGTEAGLVNGTIPSKGAQTYTPGTSNQTIAAGQYLSGIQTIAGDADLIAASILSGKNIFGVAGTCTPRKFATGTVTSTSAMNFRSHTGGSISRYPITVSGLAFTPTIIYFVRTSPYDTPRGGVYCFEKNVITPAAPDNAFILAMEVEEMKCFSTYGGTGAYVTSDGFRLPTPSGVGDSYTWVAFE